jgi:transcription antitermination protein NusB
MGARTSARHAALQLLYALELADEPAEAVIRAFWRETPGDPEGRPYADLLVTGVRQEQTTIDQRIVSASQNWRIERMTPVDRNLLRIAAYELEFVDDVPRAVAIDEAVEIAKRFGSEESSKFINGVLEKIASDLSAV